VIDNVVESIKKETAKELLEAPVAAALTQAEGAVREIQHSSSELWALYEVAQTLSSSLGIQETLEILCGKIAAILPGTSCVFLLRDGRADILSVYAAVGVNKEFFECAKTLSPESVSVKVMLEKHSFLGEFDMDDLLLTKVPLTQWVQPHTALVVPIVHRDEVLGTINVYHAQPNAFSPHDVNLLETIASRAAMALYNGMLYDQTRGHWLTDPVTGLSNVRFLTQHVEDLCRFFPEPFALMCLDLDSFKPINDNFGHKKGNKVLSDLSRILTESVRKSDIVARYGGDEFVIVLKGADHDEAQRKAKHLQELVETYDSGLVHEQLGALSLGASVGFACFPEDGTDTSSLMSAADARMHRNKMNRKLGMLANTRHLTIVSTPNDEPTKRAA
jgi:diguanylate cyclase (GGDEF)-like protein